MGGFLRGRTRDGHKEEEEKEEEEKSSQTRQIVECQQTSRVSGLPGIRWLGRFCQCMALDAGNAVQTTRKTILVTLAKLCKCVSGTPLTSTCVKDVEKI